MSCHHVWLIACLLASSRHSHPDIMQHGNETNLQPIAIAESTWPLLAITGHDARTVTIASLPAIDNNYSPLYRITSQSVRHIDFPIPPPFGKHIWDFIGKYRGKYSTD